MTTNVTVIGNLVADPDLRHSTSGKANASFTVAASRRFQTNGEWREEATFMRVVAFNELAMNVAASLAKGDRVIVSGRVSQRDYDKDGTKHTVYEVVADAIGADLRFATVQVSKVERQQR